MKLLIIQQDGPYFLHETLRVLERSMGCLKDFEVTVLVDQGAFTGLFSDSVPLVQGLTTNKQDVLSMKFDISFNLSMEEASWSFHGQVNAEKKMGAFIREGQLIVNDIWSTFLLTVKAGAPFLTFHLQDIYRNILGIKRLSRPTEKNFIVRDIALGAFNPNFFPDRELSHFVQALSAARPDIGIKKVGEFDIIDDLSHTLYIGPANLEAIRLCEAGAGAIFTTSTFQGLNLLPHANDHLLISTRGETLIATKLLAFVENFLRTGRPSSSIGYSVYQLEDENLFGAYLKALNCSDDLYPIYQAHVVLWNFLLNLFDVNLDVTQCSQKQIDLLNGNHKVLQKLLRLHQYALNSVDSIYQQAKATTSVQEKVDGHIKNLGEIEEIMANLSSSYALLRPVLDFYRIRRGQNNGDTLLETSQSTFLTYSEEHHALTALGELFSVTLRKNEVSI